MRASHVATALAAFFAGSIAATVLHRRAPRAVPVGASTAVPSAAAIEDRDAVVLPFPRPAVEQPAAPVRCGDTGGRTKAGAPCGGRAATGGRCHHHPMAA